MTTQLVMQNSIAMTTSLVQTWEKKTDAPLKNYWPQNISHQMRATPSALFLFCKKK